MLLKPIQPPLLCSTQQITRLCEHAIGTCDTPFTETRHVPHMRSVGYHLYTAGRNVYFSCLDPSFRLGQYFIIFLTECLQSRAQKEKMKTVHLFLNSAKSSEAGNRTEKSKVRAVVSLHKHSRPLVALISDGDPFKSHLTSPALSQRSASAQPRIVAAEGHRGILPARVSMSLWVP